MPSPIATTKGSALSHNTQFLKAFFRNCSSVGAISPSSPRLCSLLADSMDWDHSHCIVEYGPGTGVVTEQVSRRLRGDTRFFAVERDPILADIARRRCPDLEIVEACVSTIPQLCRERGIEKIDGIVSGLPWASFPVSLTEKILAATFEVLPPGGRFATFAYWQGLILPGSLRFRSLLREHFRTVEHSKTAWKNLPPAFVYRCER